MRSFRKAVNSALENVSFMAVITSDSDLHRPASSDLLSVCNRSTVFEREERCVLNSDVAMAPQNAERVEDNRVSDRQFIGRNHNFVGVADNWITCLTPALVAD